MRSKAIFSAVFVVFNIFTVVTGLPADHNAGRNTTILPAKRLDKQGELKEALKHAPAGLQNAWAKVESAQDNGNEAIDWVRR